MSDIPPELPELELQKQTSAIGEFVWIFKSIWNQQGMGSIGEDFKFDIQGNICVFYVYENKELKFMVQFEKNTEIFDIKLADGTIVGMSAWEGLGKGEAFFTKAVLLTLEHIKRAKKFLEAQRADTSGNVRRRVLDALALPRETLSSTGRAKITLC